ncbi:MAG: hypothetical protein U1B78_02000, partial [Dehalococcoidia bacterium]|nr:hypothetical protein [Dehalococcoidia bacterium]
MSEPQSEPDGAPAPLMEPLLAVHSAPNASWLSDAAVNAAERGIGALYAFLYLIDASGSLSGEPPASGRAARALTKVRQILNVDPTTIKLRPEEHPVIATTIAEGRGAVVANLEEVLPLDMDAGALTAAQLLLGFAEVWLVPVAWASEALGLLMLLVPPQAPASVAQAELLGRHVGL